MKKEKKASLQLKTRLVFKIDYQLYFRDERKIFDNFTTKAIENVNNELSEAAAASSQGRNECRKSGKKN